MTGDETRFLSLQAFYGGSVTFIDNKKGKIIGIGKVGESLTHSTDNVFLVKGLKHNLLSISQFCNKGNEVNFNSERYLISKGDTKEVLLEGKRIRNTYQVNLDSLPDANLTCLSVMEDDPLLWHKRLGHASLSLLQKLSS